MKKVLGRIVETLMAVPLLFLFLVLTVVAIFIGVPIDYCKYKVSRYYKDTKGKYEFLIGLSPYYKFYNAIKKADLPITYTRYKTKDGVNAYGFFLYKDTLILCDCMTPTFDEDTGKWMTSPEEGADVIVVEVEQEVNEEIQTCKEQMGEETCSRAVMLLDRNDLDRTDLKRAEENEMFLLHDGNVVEALRKFVSEN